MLYITATQLNARAFETILCHASRMEAKQIKTLIVESICVYRGERERNGDEAYFASVLLCAFVFCCERTVERINRIKIIRSHGCEFLSDFVGRGW